jgi:hypothetical protein
MLHPCTCGLEFVIVPKEIPLSEPEALRCEDCGREIRGPRCTRYADYVAAARESRREGLAAIPSFNGHATIA